MTTRRGFLKRLFSPVQAAYDDARATDNIPLNRLNELPLQIIERIQPVFFYQDNWTYNGNTITIGAQIKEKEKVITLSPVELEVFQHFQNSKRLKGIAKTIADKFEWDYQRSFETVTGLFFKFASLRIIHPKKFYHVSDIEY